MFFGKKLKELRLKHANMGLHNFANHIKMDVLFCSKMERGLIPPPPCKKWINGMIDYLNLAHDSEEAIELYELWAEPFVMQKMDENILPSPLVHKSDGTKLTEYELKSLTDHINSVGREHNKMAEEYNKEHYGLQGKDRKRKKTS